jgi:hypothetical protein
MFRFLVAAAISVVPAAAFAQPVDPIEESIVRSLPDPNEVEAMAPVLDRSLGALMSLDVGPILDAADPYGRRPGYGRSGRTLREIGRRDDPYFEERLRGSVYGATADMSRMMGAFAAAAPGLARSVRELERAFGTAIDDYQRRRGDPPPYRDDYPYPDDPYYPED